MVGMSCKLARALLRISTLLKRNWWAGEPGDGYVCLHLANANKYTGGEFERQKHAIGTVCVYMCVCVFAVI